MEFILYIPAFAFFFLVSMASILACATFIGRRPVSILSGIGLSVTLLSIWAYSAYAGDAFDIGFLAFAVAVSSLAAFSIHAGIPFVRKLLTERLATTE